MLQIVNDEFKHSLEEVWRGRNINVEQHQESAKNSGRCKTIISKRVEGFYIKWGNQSTLLTSADAIVRFTNIKKDGDIESHGKLLEREFMVHDKCYREYNRLPKDETVRCLRFHIKNVNAKYYFFYHKRLQWFSWIFLSKTYLSTETTFLRYFSRPNRTTLFASQNIVLTKPFVLRCWNSSLYCESF